MYTPDVMTYVFPLTDMTKEDYENPDVWIKAIREVAIPTIGRDISFLIAQPQKTSEKKDDEKALDMPDNLIKELEDAGIPITEDTVKNFSEVSKKNFTSGAGKTALLALPEVKKEDAMVREPKVIMNWVSFMPHPDKKKVTQRGMAKTPEVFSIRKSKEFLQPDEDSKEPIFPLNDKGLYYMYFPQCRRDLYHAKRGFGNAIQCQALYDRNPKDRRTYGIPVFMTSELEEQNCLGCKYAPHRDKSQDDRNGVNWSNQCKAHREKWGLFGGIFRGIPSLIWANWSTQGQLDFFLQTNSLMGKMPYYQHLIQLHKIFLTEEGGRKRRVLEDASDENGTVVIHREQNAKLFTWVSIISGHVKKFYEEKLKPQMAKESPTDFDPSKYEEEDEALSDI